MDISSEGGGTSTASVAKLQRTVSELQRRLKHERFAREDALTKAKLERTKLRRQLRLERESHAKRVSALIAQKRTWKQDALAGRGKELRDLRVLLEEAEIAKEEALQFSPRNAERPNFDFAGEASTLWRLLEEARKEREQLVETIDNLRDELELEREEHEKTKEKFRTRTEDVFEYAAKVKEGVETLHSTVLGVKP